MDKGGVAVAQIGGLRAVSRYQWLVFLVVWLGWTLDAADFGLYSLVLKPAMTELLGGNPPLADIGKYGGLLSMAGLLGWAFGGFLFGILADYIGRVRTLAFSIALYSVFTGLQGLSQGILDFAIYRFIAGLGTGAELMVGIPLLAETLAVYELVTSSIHQYSSVHGLPLLFAKYWYIIIIRNGGLVQYVSWQPGPLTSFFA